MLENELFIRWVIGEKIDKKSYHYIVHKMQECIDNGHQLETFEFYDSYCDLYKKYEIHPQKWPRELQLFLREIYYLNSLDGINYQLNKYHHEPIQYRDTDENLFEAISYLLEQYFDLVHQKPKEKVILDKKITALERVHILVNQVHMAQQESSYLGFCSFLNKRMDNGKKIDLSLLFLYTNYQKYVPFEKEESSDIYLYYIYLSKQLNNNKILFSSHLDYILDDQQLRSFSNVLANKYAIFTKYLPISCDFDTNKLFYFIYQDPSFFDTFYQNYTAHNMLYQTFSEQVFQPIVEIIEQEAASINETTITPSVLENFFHFITIKHPKWKYRNIKIFVSPNHYSTILFYENLYCELTYHPIKRCFDKKVYSFVDRDYNATCSKIETEEERKFYFYSFMIGNGTYHSSILYNAIPQVVLILDDIIKNKAMTLEEVQQKLLIDNNKLKRQLKEELDNLYKAKEFNKKEYQRHIHSLNEMDEQRKLATIKTLDKINLRIKYIEKSLK